jgi:hypothetical protein
MCGTTQTFKGNPLSGNYCSPTCFRKAKDRPDSHGTGIYGKRQPMADEESESYSMSNVYNPFKDLFDD